MNRSACLTQVRSMTVAASMRRPLCVKRNLSVFFVEFISLFGADQREGRALPGIPASPLSLILGNLHNGLRLSRARVVGAAERSFCAFQKVLSAHP